LKRSSPIKSVAFYKVFLIENQKAGSVNFNLLRHLQMKKLRKNNNLIR